MKPSWLVCAPWVVTLVILVVALVSRADSLNWTYLAEPEFVRINLYWGVDESFEIITGVECDIDTGSCSVQIPDLCQPYQWDVAAMNDEGGEVQSTNGPSLRDGQSFCAGDMDGDGKVGAADLTLFLWTYGSFCP